MTREYIYFQAIGQDSHPFSTDSQRPLLLGGFYIPDQRGLSGNSDADVLLHALTNALTGLSGEIILGAVADELCREGIKDSRVYVQKAMDSLGEIELLHLSFTIEAKEPKLLPFIPKIRASIAKITNLPLESVCITATSGEGLTSFGRGEGIQAFCLASARKPV